MRVEKEINQKDGINYGVASTYVKELSQQYLLNEHKFTPGKTYAYLQFAVAKTAGKDGIFRPEFGVIPTDALVNELYGVYPNTPILEQYSTFEIPETVTGPLEVLKLDLVGLLDGKYPNNNFDAGMKRLSTAETLESLQADWEKEKVNGPAPDKASALSRLESQVEKYYKSACDSIEPLTFMGDLFVVALEKQWVKGVIPMNLENHALIKKRCDMMFRLVDDIMMTEFMKTDKGKVLSAFGKNDKTFRQEFGNFKFKRTPISAPTKYAALRPTVMASLNVAGSPEPNERGRVWENGGKIYKSESAAMKHTSSINAQVLECLDFMKFKYSFAPGEVGLSSQTVNITPYEGEVPTFHEMRSYYQDILVAGPKKFRTFQEYDYAMGVDIVTEFVEKNLLPGTLTDDELASHREILEELGIKIQNQTQKVNTDDIRANLQGGQQTANQMQTPQQPVYEQQQQAQPVQTPVQPVSVPQQPVYEQPEPQVQVPQQPVFNGLPPIQVPNQAPVQDTGVLPIIEQGPINQ